MGVFFIADFSGNSSIEKGLGWSINQKVSQMLMLIGLSVILGLKADVLIYEHMGQ